MARGTLGTGRPEMTLFGKLEQISWTLVALLCVIAGAGFAMLYSAADGNLEPWASRQIIRFAVGLGAMIVIATIDLRHWLKWAYVIYAVSIALLIAVEWIGTVGMGAQRWIDLGVIRLQPSEVAKIALVLALARYFHGLTLDDVRRPRALVAPLAVLVLPALLVLRQPDLGTAVMLLIGAGAIVFMAGVPMRYFAALGVVGIAAVPLAWQFMQEYQRERIMTFLNPESDPLGSGYHILQSKIALGSGGLFGRGFMQGTQSHLNFLPEHQTDFIFTMLAEELGLVGALGLLLLYSGLLAYGVAVALRARSQFGRLLAIGVTTTLFLYVFINVAMVTGLVPVVGVPLPLISYGGTAMMTVLVAMGLLLSVYVHRDQDIRRRPGGDEP
ncbi:MAG: rod shape-determining protein RodA [Alphaproteobacteria bacterium]|jgi:rod shape determining protein RodA|nr:rod shape-determining protein RodA [Alphaproteobacteria bacterium]MDP6517386.1 rod shape-determining protein RodA [Alphaproteobacteria bacterium]